MTTLATLLLTIAPPPFQWHWPDVREHWPHVSAELEATVQVGAVVGGLIGDVHPAWLVATAFVESSFRPAVMGDRGTSFGLCQLKLRTARAAWPVVTRSDLLDPAKNLVVAGRGLRPHHRQVRACAGSAGVWVWGVLYGGYEGGAG